MVPLEDIRCNFFKSSEQEMGQATGQPDPPQGWLMAGTLSLAPPAR